MNAQVAAVQNAPAVAGNRLMVRFEVESDFVDSRGGISKAGKPYEIHGQEVWCYLSAKFPEKIQINHEDARNALAPGLYEADIRPALFVGDFGKLAIDGRKLKLVAVKG